VDHGGRTPSRGAKSDLVMKRRRNERLSAQTNDLVDRRRERCGREEQEGVRTYLCIPHRQMIDLLIYDQDTRHILPSRKLQLFLPPPEKIHVVDWLFVCACMDVAGQMQVRDAMWSHECRKSQRFCSKPQQTSQNGYLEYGKQMGISIIYQCKARGRSEKCYCRSNSKN
jgi:hypothetical protein